MAQGNPGLKKILPIMLLSAALAESAHAPLLGKASAATSSSNGKNSAVADTRSHPDPTKSPSPPLQIPPTPESSNPTDVKKTLARIDSPKPLNPWPIWTPSLPTDFTPATPTPAPTLNLLDPGAGGSTENPGTSTLSNNGNGATGSNGDPTIYSPPPFTPIQKYGDGSDEITAPAGPTGTPFSPSVTDQSAPTSSSVPEPGTISIFVGICVSLGRPRRRGGITSF